MPDRAAPDDAVGDRAGADRAVPRLSGILETSLYVEDLDRSRAFYERVFGFEPYFAEARMVALGVPGGVLLLLRRGGVVRCGPTPPRAEGDPAHDGGEAPPSAWVQARTASAVAKSAGRV